MSIKLLIIAMTAFGSVFGVGLTGKVKKKPENQGSRQEGVIIDEETKKKFVQATETPEITIAKVEEPSSPKPKLSIIPKKENKID